MVTTFDKYDGTIPLVTADERDTTRVREVESWQGLNGVELCTHELLIREEAF